MAYQTLITNLGAAKIAAAIASSSTVNLYEMALGDGNGNATTPAVTQTDLVREVYRAQLNSLVADPNNPNYLIAELVVPIDEGGWTVREVGLYDNAGALIAVGNFPDTYKPVLSEGAGRDLVVRMYIEVAQPGAISLTIDPSIVLATRQWVSDNFTLAIVLPGGTTGEVLRKASNADGDFEWWDPTSGTNIVVNVVEEEQTLTGAQTVVNLAIATTVGAAFYIEGARLFSDDFTVNSNTQITLATSYPAGSKILAVQNEPLSAFNFLGASNDLSEIAARGSSAQLAARTNIGVPEQSATVTAVLQALYPIGELLITRRSGNPSSWLGFGTWERYGKGRSIIGYDDTDSQFNTLDATGGEKTHTLLTTEIPAHIHVVDPPSTSTSNSGAHSHTIDPPSTATSSNGDHNHFIVANETTQGVAVSALNQIARQSFDVAGDNYDYSIGGSTLAAALGRTSTAGAHTHTLDIPSFTSDSGGAHTHTIDIAAFNSGSTGGGQAHNNLHPYIVAYMWKRTA